MKTTKASTIISGLAAVAIATLGLLAPSAPAAAQAAGFTYPAITFTPVHSGLGIDWSPITEPSPVRQSTTSAALWNLKPVGIGRGGATQYRVATSKTGGLCLAPTHANATAGMTLHVEACASSYSVTRQNWYVTTSWQGGSIVATLVHVNSGLVAGVRDASTTVGAWMELQPDSGAQHQRFVQRQVGAVVVPDIHDTVTVALALFNAVHAQTNHGPDQFVLLQIDAQTAFVNLQAATIQQNQINSLAAYQQAVAAAQAGMVNSMLTILAMVGNP